MDGVARKGSRVGNHRAVHHYYLPRWNLQMGELMTLTDRLKGESSCLIIRGQAPTGASDCGCGIRTLGQIKGVKNLLAS